MSEICIFVTLYCLLCSEHLLYGAFWDVPSLSVSVPLITPESCSDLLINEKQTPSSAYTSAHNTRQTSPFACMYRRNVLLHFHNWLTCAAFHCSSSAALRLFICYALPSSASVPCFCCQRKFTACGHSSFDISFQHLRESVQKVGPG